MMINPSKYAERPDSREQRGVNRASQAHTPSKRDKYDSYTPRKRYMKEQEEYDSYRNLQVEQVDPFPQHLSSQIEPEKLYNSRARGTSIPKKESISSNESKRYQFSDIYSPNFDGMYPTENRPPLNECTVKANCPTSVRKTKFKNYLENKEIVKKICFEDTENNDRSNVVQTRLKNNVIESKQRFLDIEGDFCLTPRRLNKRKEENPAEMNEKLSMIQAKIARLERMTPKRCSTPKNSQAFENPLPEFSNCTTNEREEPKNESILSSRVSIVS
jgi:hypothetical protein